MGGINHSELRGEKKKYIFVQRVHGKSDFISVYYCIYLMIITLLSSYHHDIALLDLMGMYNGISDQQLSRTLDYGWWF